MQLGDGVINKKIYFVAVVVMAVCVLIGWSMLAMSTKNLKQDMAKTFLTEMYQVKSHDRYQSLQQKLDATPAIDGTLPSHETAYEDYEKLFTPLTTAKGYSQLSKNAEYLKADSFALDNGYLFEVKSITLKSTFSDESKEQYDYIISISALSENGEPATDITAEGNLVLIKDDDGVFRVNSFKPFVQNTYDKLMDK